MQRTIPYKFINKSFAALIVLIMAIAPALVCAQSISPCQIDSIIKLVENVPESIAAERNNDVCWKLRNINPEIAIRYGMRALDIADRNEDSVQLVKAYGFIGVCQRNLNNFDEALKYYKLGTEYAIKYDLNEQLGYCFVNLGNLLIYQNDLKSAGDQLYKALTIGEQLKDSSILGYVYLNLGRVMLGENNYEKSEEFFNKSIKIRTECKELNTQVSVPKKYLADCHFAAGRRKLALEEYIETLKSGDVFGDYDRLGEIAYHISRIYYDEKKYDSALYYATNSLTYARNIGSRVAINSVFELMAGIYKIKNDYKKLSDCYIRQIECSDSLFKKQVELHNYNIQYSIASYSHQKQIEDLNRDKNESTFINLMATIILFIVAAVIWYIFTNIRKVKRLNRLIKMRTQSLQAANYEITSSIKYARRIQTSTLSTPDNIAEIFPDSMVYYVPKEIISGDWYRVEKIKGKIILAEADSTSIGVPGSLLGMMGMSIFKDTLNAAANAGSPMKASMILNTMRQQVKIMFSRDMGDEMQFEGGMDASIVVIDKETLRMSFAAAYQTAIIVRGGEIIQLKGDPMRVGKYAKETDFTEQDVQLQRGDAIFLMNNVIRDLQNPSGEKFVDGRLSQFLVECGGRQMTEIRDLLSDEFRAWSQSGEFDDMTMIGFRV